MVRWNSAYVCVLFGMLLVACARQSAQALPAATAPALPILAPTTAAPTTTAIPPTVAPTAVPTATPLPPTETPVPTATPLPPTETPLPPTEIPTDTPAPTEAALHYVFPVIADSVNYGRTHHDYPASDMFCPIGSQFVAPIGGVVDYVSREDVWNPATDVAADRGGISLAIVGDDGWRYYGSHLSVIADGIAPGVRVEAGQLLGLTGNSGNARSTPPHLHFGISHPTTPDDWSVRRGQIQPYPYLEAWRVGEDLPPSDS